MNSKEHSNEREVVMQLSIIVCCKVHLFAEGLQRLLEEDESIKILGVASDDAQIKNLMQYEPDIIITDLGSSRKVLNLLPSDGEKKVLLVNDAGDLSNENLMNMIHEGLGGILPRDADACMLQKAARKLSQGELWIDHQTLREVLSKQEDKKQDIHLTKKETEILNYICTGHTNKEIARKLYISEQTVKSHCNHLFKKFGVSSRLKLALRATPQCSSENVKNRNFM